MFVDQIKIHAKAGEGGRGCVSFRREKFVPKGGPDGGDGGRGGDIILRADPNVDNLASLFYTPIVRAKHGEHGQGKNCYGRAAKSQVVAVPVGTLVYRMPETRSVVSDAAGVPEFAKGPESDKGTKGPSREMRPERAGLDRVVDLAEPGQEFVLCRGGDGGKGNVHFKSSRNRVPRQYTEGQRGEEGDFFFELRTIADAGLVGYPNAGKSTLLSGISAAHPKVASYPFTTLHPMVGVVEFPNYGRLTVADIPGLIEGAHRDVGLGHDFLRHIVRCKLLVFVIDMAATEGREPVEDLAKLREELKLYDPTLADRPWMVAANKMDVEGAAEKLRHFRKRFPRRKIVPISAEKREGLEKFKTELAKLVEPSS